MEWNKNNSEIAQSQGWDIFALDGDEDSLMLQKLDEAEIFESDIEALELVIKQASYGDLVCRAALDILEIPYYKIVP